MRIISEESDLYPSNTFVDPMIMPLYLKTNDHSSIKEQCINDWLLSTYLYKLTQEIVDDIEELSKKKSFVSELMNTVRRGGFAIVQFYKSNIEGEDNYKIFNPTNFTEWITEIDPKTKKKIKVGAKVQWNDELDNNFTDSLYFDVRVNENQETIGKAYLVVWEKGDGEALKNAPSTSNFALADVSTAILSLAIQCRQIQATLTFGATNPFFYFFKYGDAITSPQRANLRKQMKFLSGSRAIGAKGSILDSIDTVQNSAVEKSIIALDQMVGFFAGATRLPLSFYFGEKQTGGLGDTGQEQSDKEIDNKKQLTLSHFTHYLREIFLDIWGETLPEDIDKFYILKREMKEKEAEDKKKEMFDKFKKEENNEEVVIVDDEEEK